MVRSSDRQVSVLENVCIDCAIDDSGWAWFIPSHDGMTSVGVVMNQRVPGYVEDASGVFNDRTISSDAVACPQLDPPNWLWDFDLETIVRRLSKPCGYAGSICGRF